MAFLDFIPGIVSGIGLLLVVIGLLFKKGRIANLLGMVGKPVGFKVQMTLLILGVVFLLAGGFGYWSGIVTGFEPAVITGITPGIEMVPLLGAQLTCTMATFGAVEDELFANSTFRTDPANNQHYYFDAQNSTVAPAVYGQSYNGTLSCRRPASHVGEDGAVDCWAVADTFRSETSTTDSNTYSLVALSTELSKIPGQTYAQTIYLADNALATSSSDKEITTLTFAESEAVEVLGWEFQLAGETNLNYLKENSALNVDFFCGEDKAKVFTITVMKIKETE